MCEDTTNKIPGWKGWLDVPAPKISGAAGPWIDLSHRLTEELSRIPAFPQPQIRRIWKIPEHRANVTEVHMVVHHGTHLDAPRHFIADGPAMDEVPLDRLYGPGVVWRFDTDDDGMIDVADLERATPRLRPGDIVLMHWGPGLLQDLRTLFPLLDAAGLHPAPLQDYIGPTATHTGTTPSVPTVGAGSE